MKKSALEETLALQLRAVGIRAPIRELKFHPTRKWRFDFAWPERWLAVEIDGGTWVNGRHNRPQGMKADAEKMNAAVLAGWRVLRFTREHVKSGEAVNLIEEALSE